MSQKDTKMSPKGAKGAPKVSSKSTKIPQKVQTSKNVDFRGAPVLSFDSFLTYLSSKNTSKNRSEQLCRKTLQKTLKISKKQSTIPPPKIKILKFLLQRRILQNSVFTREKQCVLKIQCLESVHTLEKHPRKK